MSERAKPLLHLVQGGQDDELYNADLDFYFGVLDSECGLKSLEALADDSEFAGYRVGGAEPDESGGSGKVKTKTPIYVREAIPYTDHHVTYGKKRKGVFTQGREIWKRLTSLPWPTQELLRKYYEPRRDRLPLDEQDIRAAHRAYLEACRAS